MRVRTRRSPSATGHPARHELPVIRRARAAEICETALRKGSAAAAERVKEIGGSGALAVARALRRYLPDRSGVTSIRTVIPVPSGSGRSAHVSVVGRRTQPLCASFTQVGAVIRRVTRTALPGPRFSIRM